MKDSSDHIIATVIAFPGRNGRYCNRSGNDSIYYADV